MSLDEEKELERKIREEFVRLLTTDSETKDRRRRDYNQALFMSDGEQVWTSISLDMVMDAFDRAVRNVHRNNALKRLG